MKMRGMSRSNYLNNSFRNRRPSPQKQIGKHKNDL